MRSLLDATQEKYKYIINSTVIQHDEQNRPRGMHSAQVAFWDSAVDGCWSWKFDGAEGEQPREFDLVLNITWVSMGQQE
jgi:Tctex-1 family